VSLTKGRAADGRKESTARGGKSAAEKDSTTPGKGGYIFQTKKRKKVEHTEKDVWRTIHIISRKN